MIAARHFPARQITILALWLVIALTRGTAGEINTQPPPPFAKGPVARIDLINKQLTLKLKDGEHTFTITDQTYIFRGKEKITADKLKLGEIIALSFYTDAAGRTLVRRIKAPEVAPPVTDSENKPGPPAEP